MARLRSAPNDMLHRALPDKDKMKLALEWLCSNPTESLTAAARIYHIEKEKSVQRAWNRERKRIQFRTPTHGSQNKIFRPEQHQAIIQYAVDQAANSGRGATK
jgi:hypothetical protein